MSQEGKSSEEKPSEKNQGSKPSDGLFITKEMRLDGELTLSLGPGGGFDARLKTGLDLCPYWVDISLGHLEKARDASEQALKAHAAGDDKSKGDAMRTEFKAGMQSITASNIALDAFYANVKEYIEEGEELTKEWRKGGLARYAQIAEILRRAYSGLSNDKFNRLRDILEGVTKRRDKSVHPPPGTRKPVWHPELEVSTDWRFVYFRFHNAKIVARAILNIIVQVSARPRKDRHEGLAGYCKTLSGKLSPFVEEWEKQYGKLE